MNIFDNNFNDNVICYPIALASKNKLSKLNIFKMGWGHSLHSFDTDIKIGITKQNPVFKQGSFGMSLDDVIEQTKFFVADYLANESDRLADWEHELEVINLTYTLKYPDGVPSNNGDSLDLDQIKALIDSRLSVDSRSNNNNNDGNNNDDGNV